MILPSCHDVQTELTEYLEGSLPLRRRISFWIHLLFCRVCAGFLRGLRALPGQGKIILGPPREAPEEAAKTLTGVLSALSSQQEP